ncbi:FAD-dependent oxidoreductase [candidate division KSB1 bacterium]
MDPETATSIRELPVVIASKDMSWNRTGSWSLLKPEFVSKTPPCQGGCPASVPVRDILAAVKKKEIEKAVELFIDAHPFPAITGRVCHHPCQTNCLRMDFDGSLEIRAIERFISEHVTPPKKVISNIKEKIAIIGSGPSGLSCAYYLRKTGYEVTIFESSPLTGGLLRYGIPAYRLPDEILDSEIDRLDKMGIEFRTNISVNSRFIEEELKDYSALFLGIGAHISRKMEIPGEELPNVISGLKFLINFENYRDKFINRRIAVIGGGNTAMDAARTSLRLGAEVDIIYRRTRDEMPAIPEEITGAEEEGCKFEFLAAPERIIENDENLDVMFINMKLGDSDDSGRRRPEKIPGSIHRANYDFVITAIGEDPDFKDFGNQITISGNAIITDHSGRTDTSRYYAGGDAAGYSRTVADAIASGKRAAGTIDRILENRGKSDPDSIESLLAEADINTDYFEQKKAVVIKNIDLEKRKNGFTEIISGLNEEEAVREASRCFHCGECTYCDNCVIFCPDFAIRPSGDKYEVLEIYCKGCGICIKECPRGILQWKGK